ncbi:MAG: PQQ-dependent sugar dehydrogenase [Anaerolineales bacterium]|nr:PQQ-dependent sugar dehydrogenase [Anaerolineales bacterium]
MLTVARRRHIYALLLILLWVAGCNQNEAPTVAPATATTPPTTVAQVTDTPTATSPAPVDSPTATALPTDTPVPDTATPTLPPTATFTPSPTYTPWPVPQVVRDVAVNLPAGFSFVTYAELYRPTAFAFDDSGRLFVASFDGTIHILLDNDQNGRADLDTIYYSGFSTPLGLAFRPGTHDLYVSDQGRITILKDADGDSVVDELVTLVQNLPYGRHQNDDLVFGPDGWLYIGVGSTCDACEEEDPRSATIMRIDPDTGMGAVYATGMRNPFGLAFDPASGALFATDNGRDDLGPDEPQEEFNHIRQGYDYGFPYCWDNMTEGGCENSSPAIGFFTAHSSANNVVFYEQTEFPPNFQGDAYVTIFGSWVVPDLPTGIMRVSLTPAGDSFTTQMAWFATWEGGMPLGLVVGPDGAMYVGDYINNRVYRISYGFP